MRLLLQRSNTLSNEIIETYWNVNSDAAAESAEPFRNNRNILECKLEFP